MQVKARKAAIARGDSPERALSTVRVIAQGGDGGTTDIGFGCLSGMFERNDDVLYICYDNEAYMNTGVQRSPAHRPQRPPPHDTVGYTLSRLWQGKNLPPSPWRMKSLCCYCPIADLHDLEAKVERPCRFAAHANAHSGALPAGWGAASHDTIKLARLAHESGIFPVLEAEHGEITSVLKIRRRVPVQDYLRLQKRFAHLFGKDGAPAADVARIQADADRNIRRFHLFDEESA